ncbi:response regulator [Mucilaginibacter ginsenosidivorans]|uniref:Response regulator n=1 Tax=Mucilaginibacter ginsenosidivorans TaxID=398053 RepID=A0A5B8V257_9SPHI|nr:response regulator [Mucilaginibacter ginsenosidivorans]QEC65155.1 response regulator [Mucilaginibacter ginsenosidivorans]
MKVLIIEDDEDTREALGYIAAEQGCRVYYGDGDITLSRIKKISPDLLILDDWVNNYQGTSICDLVKLNSATKHVQVMLISTRPNIEEIAKGCKCDAYLSKPFNLDELQHILYSLAHCAPGLA